MSLPITAVVLADVAPAIIVGPALPTSSDIGATTVFFPRSPLPLALLPPPSFLSLSLLRLASFPPLSLPPPYRRLFDVAPATAVPSSAPDHLLMQGRSASAMSLAKKAPDIFSANAGGSRLYMDQVQRFYYRALPGYGPFWRCVSLSAEELEVFRC